MGTSGGLEGEDTMRRSTWYIIGSILFYALIATVLGNLLFMLFYGGIGIYLALLALYWLDRGD